ncbi:hypothetical protein CBW56_09500 [Denitratisoma oestradiolicum]|nr:hypothetical protein CBW56_09500 [Denitratisoma oestradiolicum]
MILGVGNKDSNYGDFDVDTLQLIGNSLWHIAHSARIERALATSLEKVQTILNTVSEAIFLHDENGAIVEVNASAMGMYGYGREVFLNLRFDDLIENISPHSTAEVQAMLAAVRSGIPQNFEWQARRFGGELFWVDGSVRLVTIGGQTFLLTVVRDITERRRLQVIADAHVRDLVALNKKLEDAHIQVLQSEKMASIGQLAAGVAHEINNPVGYVISNISSLEKYLHDFVTMLDVYEKAEPAMEATTRDAVRRLREELDIGYLKRDVVSLLAESREGVGRVRKIVQDLKDFSRVGAEDEWQWTDIHEGLDSTLNIVWNELKYKTTVEKAYGDLPQIYCLPSQLNQVFMNLLVNAAHAIENKGIVILRTGREGRMVWVEVEDNGSGISPENLTRIFDPFFTTKPVGKGTGLGLSVSYSIVQKHQGRIEVRSEPGKGTVFRVWLPIEPVQGQATQV